MAMLRDFFPHVLSFSPKEWEKKNSSVNSTNFTVFKKLQKKFCYKIENKMLAGMLG
jgi:hypothetical protein